MITHSLKIKHTPKRHIPALQRLIAVIAVCIVCVIATDAKAACTSPAGDESKTIYDFAAHTLKYCDGTNWVTASAGSGGSSVPSGAVMAFNLSSCPSGWSALASAVGRTVVGSGTYAANADADGSNSALSYTLTATGGNADLVLTVAQMPSHNHSVDPPATTTDTTGAHTHTVATGTSNGTSYIQKGTANSSPSNTGSAGNHSHTVDIPAFLSANAGSSNAFDERMPYIALLYCQKD